MSEWENSVIEIWCSLDCESSTNVAGSSGNNSNTVIVAVSVSVSGILIVACVVIFAIWTYKSKARYDYLPSMLITLNV